MQVARAYPPGPRTLLSGPLLLFYRDPLKNLMYMAKFGEISHFKLRFHLYLLNNPDYIKEVLVGQHHQDFIKSEGLRVTKAVLGEGLLTSEGEFHHKQRRLIQPAFHQDRLASYANVMVEFAGRLSEEWKDGAILDVHEEMSRLTLAIVGKTLFDADVTSDASEIGRALTQALEHFNRFNNPLAPILEKLPLPSNRRFVQARKSLDAIIYRIISERRAEGKGHGDLLSMLLSAQDEQGQKGMSDRQVRDEAMTLFLAGHETTATALTWTWYLLSQNPEAGARLSEEITEVLGGRAAEFSDVRKLRYTNAVLTESMRLYPPAWAIAREATERVSLGGYYIPKGSVLVMSQYVMHHNPRYFPEPERFLPERWTDEMRRSLPKFAYFPFGGGSRICVGEPFAWMEGALLLATIAQKWRMRHVPGHRVELLPRITLRPKYGMLMKLTKKAGQFTK